MLPDAQLVYRDLGGDYFARRDPARATKRLVAKLQALGYQVTLGLAQCHRAGAAADQRLR
jgi:hypothetical protein